MSHKVICPKLVGQRLNIKSVLPGNSFHNTAMHIRYSSQNPALHRTVLSVKSIFDNGREYYILKNMTKLLLFSCVRPNFSGCILFFKSGERNSCLYYYSWLKHPTLVFPNLNDQVDDFGGETQMQNYKTSRFLQQNKIIKKIKIKNKAYTVFTGFYLCMLYCISMQ